MSIDGEWIHWFRSSHFLFRTTHAQMRTWKVFPYHRNHGGLLLMLIYNVCVDFMFWSDVEREGYLSGSPPLGCAGCVMVPLELSGYVLMMLDAPFFLLSKSSQFTFAFYSFVKVFGDTQLKFSHLRSTVYSSPPLSLHHLIMYQKMYCHVIESLPEVSGKKRGYTLCSCKVLE